MTDKLPDQQFRELELLYRDAPIGLCALDVDLRYLHINSFLAAINGFSVDEHLGRTIAEVVPEVAAGVETQLRQVIGTGEPILEGRVDAETPASPGIVKKYLHSYYPNKGADGKVIGVSCVVQDVTERLRGEQARREREEYLRWIVETVPSGIEEIDVSGTIIFANTGLHEMYGYAAGTLIGKSILDMVVPDNERDELRERLVYLQAEQPPSDTYFGKKRKRQGEVIDVQVDWTYVRNEQQQVTGFVSVITDVTERQRAEEDRHRLESRIQNELEERVEERTSQLRAAHKQLRQSQKLEAIGRLAGGVAHDFNNMLTAIIGNAALLLSDDLHLADIQREEVEAIRGAAERAGSLTQQLLAFSRRQMLMPQILDLNASVVEMGKMLRRMIGEDVELITELDSALGNVKADPGQVGQVIMNLALNARDAMPEGGELKIGTASLDVDAADARLQDGMMPGRYVMLVVSDTGCGMDVETREKIFEPFFTTKGTGEGTGLGLSTVYGIVKQSDGFIGVDSEPGLGTTFKIYLPRVDEVTEPLEPRTDPVELRQGTETVLLVEDEEMVRALVGDVLERNGYRVLEAPGGPKAIEIAEQHEGHINLLLTDVVMPGMSGRELAEELTRLRPELKVLYMSGYTAEAPSDRGLSNQGTPFLQKPFTPPALMQRVRDLLDLPGNG